MAEEDWGANKIQIESVCSDPANSVCADCGADGTRWATVNHGQFVCIRCSGIHRSLGTHITKVKSTNLDKWTKAEVAVAQLIGNKVGRQLFEARLPPREKPAPEENDANVREFITKKYDDKKYAAPDWAKTVKKIYKTAGYKVSGADKDRLNRAKADAKGETGAAAADGDIAGGKKSKKSSKAKEAVAAGVFGTVTVADDVHDTRLAAVLQSFGLEAPVAPAAAAAQSGGDDAGAAAASGDADAAATVDDSAATATGDASADATAETTGDATTTE